MRPGRDLPVAEELRDAAGLEHRADLADERPDEGVAGAATVAVLVERQALVARRDDEGRVADDERERLSRNGIEQVAREQLDVGTAPAPADAASARLNAAYASARSEMSVATIERACPVEVQGLHAAPRAEVERALDGSTDGPRREGRRGAADAEHVVDAAAGRPTASSERSEATHQSWASSP